MVVIPSLRKPDDKIQFSWLYLGAIGFLYRGSAKPNKKQCSKKQLVNPSKKIDKLNVKKLDQYFESYCDYTGNLGIGFVAWHTYDYKFRQRLKTTKDLELKRLYVLEHLYRSVDQQMRYLEANKKRTGKNEYRKLTQEEREKVIETISANLDHLDNFDPGDPEREIKEHRETYTN